MNGCVATSLDLEMVGGLVVLIVAQNKGEMVGAFLVEVDDATMDIGV